MMRVTGEMVDVAQEHKGIERCDPSKHNILRPL
jgi:hypothetical protein